MDANKSKSYTMIVGTIVILLTTFILYYTLVASKKTASEQINDNSGTVGSCTDWELCLNRDAHTKAKIDWCTSNGYMYDAVEGKCLYTQSACEGMSNNTYKYREKQPLLEWINGKCVDISSLGVINHSVCQNEIFKTDYNADLGFTAGDLNCDKDGICTLKVDCTDPANIDSGKCPTCIIPASYCNSKGLGYTSMNGIGDCNESDVQAVFEAIFGKTLTRTFKRNWQNMQKECSQKLLSINCAKGIGTFITTGDQIIARTYQQYANSLINGVKNSCGADFTSNPNQFIDCAWAIMQFDPAFYLTEMGVKMADGMLTTLFGWTGMPPNVIQRGIGYAVKYGIKAISAIFHFGELAVLAIDKAGHLTMAFLEKIPVLGPFAKFTDFGLALAGLDAIVKYSGPVAIALAHIGVGAVHVLIQVGEAGAYVLNAAIGAALHPVDFAEEILKGLEDTVKNPKKTLDMAVVIAIKSMKSAGKLSQASWNVFKSGVKIAGADLSDVWNAMNKELNNIENDLKKGFDDAIHSIGSLF